ncbi:LysR family transcriptional regulator [Blastococcus sp. TF02A-35]|uniref:LysR family transcriptional regulator n=1 Tax=Blastococcus sp. TF02A-35 TaxID=2559612 RepID=UPI0010736F7B|nr:LysR family transcriptional regulator [Blastococcus sp. TF02A_35]TFV52515.1 LysR family transcriptional regulator [Blastococcus sp. TF02A_35]
MARDQAVPEVDPRRLLVFRTVGRAGSMSAAARELGWTAPAVSQQLKRLERDLGQPLLLRSARGIRLTEAGQVLLRHADAIAARLGVAAEELSALADLRAGRVRLAAFPSASATLVPRAMRQLAERFPELQVRLTEADPAVARQLLLAGEVDLALLFAYDEEGESFEDLVTLPLADDPIRAVLPPGHPRAADPEVSLADLSDEQWVAGCVRCRTHLMECAAVAGFTPDIRHVTDDYVVTQTLVAAGLGVALLPELALAAASPSHTVTAALVPPQGRRLLLAHAPGAESLPSVAETIAALLAAVSG